MTTVPTTLLGVAHLVSAWAPWLVAVGAGGWLALRAMPSAGEVRLRAVLPTRRQRWPVLVRAVGVARERVDTVLGRIAARRRRAVIDVCRVLASELRAGRDPGSALEAATQEAGPPLADELARVVAVAHAGDDPVAALRAASAHPGATGLGYLAACWRVASSTGAGLAAVVDRLAESLAHEESRRQELTAQLAGPRATAVLLSLLPAVALPMAAAMGSAPLRFLLTTPVGLGCLLLGLALDALGLWWTRRLVQRVLRAFDPG